MTPRRAPDQQTAVPCWSGLTVDHLYEDCPNRTSAEKTLRAHGLWFQCIWLVDPDGDLICRRCQHRHHLELRRQEQR